MIDKRSYWELIEQHKALARGHSALTKHLYADDCAFHACAPFAILHGADAIIDHFWPCLITAFPDLERRTDTLVGGSFKNGDWIVAYGHFVGQFVQPLFGIAPTGRPHWLRYGWYDRVEGGKVVESYVILDLVQLMIEAGQCPLRAQPGASWFPAPASHDGISIDTGDPAASDASLKLVEAMIAGLMRYDGRSLASMKMTDFWTPDFMWYGPGGIGSARGHKDYERAHQGPFLHAFPDRIGGNHKCRIGDGHYVASTGWPSINATHTGSGWLGIDATQKRITMRIMDLWRREGDRLVENWVFIDLVDLLAQFGVDLLPNHERAPQ